MVYKYLYLIEKDCIKTFHHREDRFEIVKHKGNETYRYDDMFWTWWEDVTSYIDPICIVDFCFIIEENSNVGFDEIKEKINKYNYVENSCWDKNTIEKFITNKFVGSKVILKDNINEYIIQNNIIMNNNPKCFNIITYPECNKILDCRDLKNIKQNNVKNSEITSESRIASYYRLKTSRLK